MKQRIIDYYRNLTLAAKIRASYLILIIPFLVMLGISVGIGFNINNKYNKMIESAVAASEFSLDFKKDFDEKTYLIIVGNKTSETSQLDSLLENAGQVVGELQGLTVGSDSTKKLKSARKYINNLEVYKNRIKENLEEGDMYEENILIWENDVQIVTGLLQDTMSEYIYYEIRTIQEARDAFNKVFIRRLIIILILLIILGGLFVLISIYVPSSISHPIEEISDVTKQITEGNLSSRTKVATGGEVGALAESLNAMIDKINELIDQVTIEQMRLKDAELELLQSQINPHFLYNTLDTIVWLAEAGEQKRVVSMVGSLSDFFRTSLSKGKDILTLREELVHVRSYLEIQHVRYQDILEYYIEVPEELMECQIPKITLQPLVENALYHGIKNKRGMGKITISGRIDGSDAIVVVDDNGKGMEPERLKMVMDKISGIESGDNEIYGILNVDERIKLRFGDDYGLRFESIYGEGTTVEIVIPLNN